MGYILKNTSGLVNTRLTDTGRQKLSQGNFNIAYFQIGDSEVSYNVLPSATYNQFNSLVLEPSFNAQNSTGVPQSNKENVKYPFYVDGTSGNTYGIPFMDSISSPIFNRAAPRGFFSGTSEDGIITSWSALTNNEYVINANYLIQMNTLVGSSVIDIISSGCSYNPNRNVQVGDIITIFFDGVNSDDCICYNLPTPTPTPSSTPSVSCDCLFISATTETCGGDYTAILSQSVIIDGKVSFSGTGCTEDTWTIQYNSGATQWEAYLGLNLLSTISSSSTFPIGTWSSINPEVGIYESFCVPCELPMCFYIERTNISQPDGVCTINYLTYLNGKPVYQMTLNDCVTPLGLFVFWNPTNNRWELTNDFITVYAHLDNPSDYPESTLIYPWVEDNPTGFIRILGSTFGECVSLTPTPTPTSTNLFPCESPTPTPTPTATCCVTPTPSRACPPIPEPDCLIDISSCYSILTYKVIDVCLNQNRITLDRPTPDFSYLNTNCYAKAIVYPPNITSLYDSVTPSNHWSDNVINFESVCYIDELNVKIWNMNIPWSENPAGLNPSTNVDYTNFGSINYLGTKEYLGYASSSGQTDTSFTYYYDSLDNIVILDPEDQKVISIVHFTNQTVDLFYGEKFALEPLDESADDTTGQARNFKVHLPWLMWHKNPNCCLGQTFWVDPPGYENLNLFEKGPYYLKSKKNPDMNDPGIRYYHLYDNNTNFDGFPSRVGKVFPDSKLIIFDDEEIIAAMSYKSNRNWTLPAPQISLITPNTCGFDSGSSVGLLTGDSEYLYVTYRFTNDFGFTNSLHCNYYRKIQGPNLDCSPGITQNVALRFGPEFGCLNSSISACTNPCDITTGFYGENFEIICQKVIGNNRPDSSEWRVIDFTPQLTATSINGLITVSGLTGTTFVITQNDYDAAPLYDLADYIDITALGNTDPQLNFGDEYYFYGNIETDIQATIYEMRYKINLSQVEFQTSSNPTWNSGLKPYITEIGLFDNDKDLLIISKMQSPILRQGVQQFLIKFDI